MEQGIMAQRALTALSFLARWILDSLAAEGRMFDIPHAHTALTGCYLHLPPNLGLFFFLLPGTLILIFSFLHIYTHTKDPPSGG